MMEERILEMDQKQQKRVWTAEIYIHHSNNCYRVRCGCQKIHLSRDRFSYWRLSDPQHLTAEETWSRTPDFRKEKILHPPKKTCSSVHNCPARPNTWEHGGDKIHCSNHYRPNWETNLQFFIAIWGQSVQLYFVQQNIQIVHTDSQRGRADRAGVHLVIWFSSLCNTVTKTNVKKKTHSKLNKDHAKWPMS